MDRELLKSKTLSDLREIAKLAGVKSVTTYRKKELLEILFQLEEQNHQAEQEEMSPMPEHSDSQKTADEDYLPMDIFEKEEEEEEPLDEITPSPSPSPTPSPSPWEGEAALQRI